MRRTPSTSYPAITLAILAPFLLASCVAGPAVQGPGPYGTYPSPPSSGPSGEPWYPPAPPPLPPPPPATIRLSVFPSEIHFDDVPENSSASLETRIRNDGGMRVRVGAVTVEGRSFDLAGDGCTGAWLAPGRSCTLGVIFFPDRPGRFEGTVQVHLEEPYDGRLAIPLEGVAGRARFPDIRVEPRRLEYGDLEPGETRVERVEVRNVGGADLVVRGVSVDGQGFTRRDDSCSGRSLRPGHACEVVIGFAPPSRGAYAGVLGITSNDPDDRLVNIPLSGAGRSTRFPQVRLLPERLDFGQIPPGAERIAEVEVRNEGNDELAVKGVTLEGLGFSGAGDRCSGRSIPPGRSCLVRVAFRPTDRGTFSGLLGVASNDPARRLAAAELRGSAERPRPPEPSCPVEELRPFRGRDADEPLLLTGSLRRGGCIRYVFRVPRRGVLTVCTPPGYSLEGQGFVPVPEQECRIPRDRTPYLTWRKSLDGEETEVRDLTITRGNRGVQDFTFLFALSPAEGEGGGGRGR